jgi:hypothetical protein
VEHHIDVEVELLWRLLVVQRDELVVVGAVRAAD